MTQSQLRFSGDIKDYRQPMVTSLGIILGFLLNFLATWSAENEAGAAIQTTSDWLIVITLLVSLLGMLWVLYRVLNNRLASPDTSIFNPGAAKAPSDCPAEPLSLIVI